jgi:hypothetical protein
MFVDTQYWVVGKKILSNGKKENLKVDGCGRMVEVGVFYEDCTASHERREK